MKITKFGHSCLLVEEQGARILFDPGSYSTVPELNNIDAILVTHEHHDHLDVPTLKRILELSPAAVIYANADVAGKLAAENIKAQALGHNDKIMIKGVAVEGFGVDHALIHPEFPRAKNTGYMIAGRFYHPGDALFVPEKPVEILAIPVVAPWSKISETIEYMRAIKPRVSFPIHDAFLKPGIGLFIKLVGTFAEKQETRWLPVEDGKPIEL